MKKQKQSLLWQVQGGNIKEPSYFFGTMHVRDKQAFRGLDFLKSCIQKCDAFAAEFNLNDADPTAMQEATQLPNGQRLEDLFSPNTYKKLAKVVQKSTEYSIEQFQHSSPFLLLNFISEAQFGTDNQQALDSTLFEFAARENKILLGLESFEQQIAIFGKIDLQQQCRSLKKVAHNFEAFSKDLKKTAQYYIQGDIQKLQKKAKRSIGNMKRVLLYDRNVKMVDSFEKIAAQQSLFAAVGAGHLAGQKGVLRLLKKRGYTVTPVIY